MRTNLLLLATFAIGTGVSAQSRAGLISFPYPGQVTARNVQWHEFGNTYDYGYHHAWWFQPVPMPDGSTRLAMEQTVALNYLRSQYSSANWTFSAATTSLPEPIQPIGQTLPDATPNGGGQPGPGAGLQVAVDYPQPTGVGVSREYIVIQRRFNDTEKYLTVNYNVYPQLMSTQSLGGPFVPRGQQYKSLYPQVISQDGFYMRPKTNEFRNIIYGKVDACVLTSFVAMHYFDQYGHHSVVLYNGVIHQNSFKSGSHTYDNFTSAPRAYPWPGGAGEPVPF